MAVTKFPRAVFLLKMIRYQRDYGDRVFHVSQQEPGTVRIDRTTIHGNPYPMSVQSPAQANAERLRVCHQYYDWLVQRVRNDPDYRAQVKALRFQNVECHCNHGSNALNHTTFCHGMILLACADALVNVVE